MEDSRAFDTCPGRRRHRHRRHHRDHDAARAARALADEPGVVLRYDLQLTRALQLAPVITPAFLHVRRDGVGFSGFAGEAALELRWLATEWLFAVVRSGATLLVFADGSTASRLGLGVGLGTSF